MQQNFTTTDHRRFFRNCTRFPERSPEPMVRHQLSRFALPNSSVQQAWCYAPGQLTGPPCQQQNANNFETMGDHFWMRTSLLTQHRRQFSSTWCAARKIISTPTLFPRRSSLFHTIFQQGYFKGMVTIGMAEMSGRSAWNPTTLLLNENFNYIITAPVHNSIQIAPTFSFPGQPQSGERPELEHGRCGWTRSTLGNGRSTLALRWITPADRQRAGLPTSIACALLFPVAGIDPALCLTTASSRLPVDSESLAFDSPEVGSGLNPDFLRLPGEAFGGKLLQSGRFESLAASQARRKITAWIGEQLRGSTIKSEHHHKSSAIAFDNSIIYGAEAKLEVPNWQGFPASPVIPTWLGQVWSPGTGGLFLV